jgi:eukaryotic-like serine/threonine-protein kinase
MPSPFGRYELLERLAGGGMGEVYLARQQGPDGFEKLLVVKTLLEHLSCDEELILMFKDEARVTARLIHPNICQVFEFEQANGVYYMAMEYLRGDDLRRLSRECERQGKPLPPELVCRIISDAAAGLDFAHSLRDPDGKPYGIVHRDISPQNIFVTFEGAVKVIDFGVAKAAGRAQHTRTGALKGKCSYMSPEQAAGQPVDNRSDIFALGIVLHELLSGQRLFKGDSDLETLARVEACEVPSLASLPKELDAIVLKALAKNREDRYRTAQELRLLLEDWLTQNRMRASSAHLSEFLKSLYAERLATKPRETVVSSFEPTKNNRTPSTGVKSSGRIWGAIGTAAAVVVASVVIAAPKPVVSVQAVPPPPVIVAAVAPPSKQHLVTLQAEPPGAEIYEGSRLLGKAPKIWTDAGEGEHELRLSHDGYRDETRKIVVEKDGQEFSFKLRRLEALKKPELEIKAER